MRYLIAHPSLPAVSRLAFGCASLGGRVGAKKGLRALALAHDLGVNLFDTARSYGFGSAERILGDFLRTRRRDRVVVMTKAGIAPPRFGRAEGAARAAILRAASILPAAVGRSAQRLFVPDPLPLFTPARLRSSLEQSLRELRTDYVDVFFLHATPAAALERSEIFDLARQLRAEGKARLVGISGSPEIVFEALRRYPSAVDALQYAVDARTVLADAHRPAPQDRFRCLMQPLAGGRLPDRALRKPESLRVFCDGRSLRECASELLVSSVIELASPPAPVLLSSWRREHIIANCGLAAAPRFAEATLTDFARWAGTMLGSK